MDGIIHKNKDLVLSCLRRPDCVLTCAPKRNVVLAEKQPGEDVGCTSTALFAALRKKTGVPTGNKVAPSLVVRLRMMAMGVSCLCLASPSRLSTRTDASLCLLVHTVCVCYPLHLKVNEIDIKTSFRKID